MASMRALKMGLCAVLCLSAVACGGAAAAGGSVRSGGGAQYSPPPATEQYGQRDHR